VREFHFYELSLPEDNSAKKLDLLVFMEAILKLVEKRTRNHEYLAVRKYYHLKFRLIPSFPP